MVAPSLPLPFVMGEEVLGVTVPFKFKSNYISYGIHACRVFREGMVAKDAGWWGDEKQGVTLPTEMCTCEHTQSREPFLSRYIRENMPKVGILPASHPLFPHDWSSPPVF